MLLRAVLADLDVDLDIGMLCAAVISVATATALFFMSRRMRQQIIDIHLSLKNGKTIEVLSPTVEQDDLGSS